MASHPSDAHSPSKIERVNKFLSKWARSTLFEYLTMVAVSLSAFAIYRIPSTPMVARKFPLAFNGSVITGPLHLSYPYQDLLIPSWLVGLMCLLQPYLWYLLGQIFIRSAQDFCNAILGTTWAVVLATFCQVFLKHIVGGLRPYFLEVCMPDGKLASPFSPTDGVGFGNVMYTIDACTQEDIRKLKNAMTSFPSGHTAVAFAGYGFLFLWLNGKFKIWADHRPSLWKVLLTFLPLADISLICVSVLLGDAHHWYDIVAGAAIGIAMSLVAYRNTYAAIWDWRFNHLPLNRKEAFRYDKNGDYDRGRTFSRVAGWGGRQKKPQNTVNPRREDRDPTEENTMAGASGDQAV